MAFRRRYREALPPDQAPTEVIQEDVPVPPPGPPPPGPPGEPREWWQWLLLALVVLAIVAGLAAYFATRGEDKNVVVPKVVGLTQAAAETRLHGVKLETKASHEFNSKPVGIVVAQSPGGGTQTGTGDVVALTVSKGPHAVSVPNTVSLTEADAVAQLTDAGLEADVVQVPSNARAGTVVAQSPKGGISVDPGSTVRLNVSRGRTQTTTVTTTTQTTATATTTTATTTTQPTTTTATTTQTTTQTTTTTAQASVADVVGSTLSRAVARMRVERLLADSYPVVSDEGGGTVVAQNPVAGTNVDAGSIVRLNVSTGTDRPSLTVPDVTDANQAAARRALSKTFTVRTVYRSGEQPGIVVGQLPAADAQAKRWAQVIIYVGR